MRTTIFLIAAVTLSHTGCGKNTPVPPPSGSSTEGDDLKLFAGKWAVVKIDTGGDETPPMDEFESTVIEINGTLVSLKEADRRGEGEYATIRLGAPGSKEIDLTEADKDGKAREREVYTSATWSTGSKPPPMTKKPAETAKGLYKFDGNTLTVVFTTPSQPRPTEFVAVARDKAKRDSGVFVLTFKKIDDAEAFKRVTKPRRPSPTTAFTRPKPTMVAPTTAFNKPTSKD